MRSRVPLLLVAGAAALGVTLVVIHVSPQVRAGPPPPVTVLDVTSLRDNGRTLVLAQRSVDGVALLEPRTAGGLKGPRPLAAAADGLTLAVSTVDVGRMGPLTLARADGSQLEVALPGVRGAAFAPDGTWLAVVDLSGALWRVDARSGAASTLATGPFAPDVSVLSDGRILAVRLSAVDAPLWAAAETVDGTTGAVISLAGSLATEAQLVYAAAPLADGAISIVRHRTGGGVGIVRLDATGTEATLAALDGAAIVDVAPDGRQLAFPADGSTWLAAVDAPGDAVEIGRGTPARFSPDGSLLMVLGPDAAAIVDRSGRLVDHAGPAACWTGGGRGCRP